MITKKINWIQKNTDRQYPEIRKIMQTMKEKFRKAIRVLKNLGNLGNEELNK
jgi:transcriptional regulatory protein LevR